MPEPFIIPRRQIDYGALGQAVAQPMQQQQAIMQTLAPLLFKAQLEKQGKLDELELEHQFEMRKAKEFKELNPDSHIRMKLQGGKTILESLDKKQLAEEQAVERQPQLGGVLSYIQKAAQQGAGPTVYREPTKRYTTPEEIKSIMGAYESGRKSFSKSPEGVAKVFQRKEEIKQVSKARKDLDTYTSDAMQSLVALDKLKKQAATLPEFKRGIPSQIASTIDIAGKKFGKEENVTRYIGVVSQELIPMARKLQEEKGPITEWDVDRVERGLGSITAPFEDKVFLLNELEKKVKKALINKAQVAGLTTEEFAQKYPSLFNRVFKKR